MKDINKILAKAHFKCKYFFLNDAGKKTHFCGIMSLKLLEVSLSCLHFSLMFSGGRSQVSLFFASVASPVIYIFLRNMVIPKLYMNNHKMVS